MPEEETEQRVRVLVVDDEPSVLLTTAALLSDDFEVFTASSGAEALELLSRQSVDVICADYKMPGMDGIELLRRASEVLGFIGGVLVTGARLELPKDSSDAVLHTLRKPYSPEELLGVVRQAGRLVLMRRRVKTFASATARLA